MTARPAGLRYGGILAAALLAAFALKLFVLDAVHVPSRSMEPAILHGDFLLLDKTGYSPAALAFRHPRRGDVVAFDPPAGSPEAAAAAGSLILKRCVAVAGDTIAWRGGALSVNGSAVAPGVADPGPLFTDGTPHPVPRKGDRIPLDSAHCALWKKFIAAEGHTIGDAPGGGMTIDGTPADTYTVREDYMFVMGDNHAVSLDSRTWGFVPERGIAGTAILVYWSLSDGGGVRWDRVGSLVR
jgi:signal peptidase I